MMQSDILVGKFELQSMYYLPFWMNAQKKGMNAWTIRLSLLQFLEERLWHWIPHEAWYVPKQRKKKKEKRDNEYTFKFKISFEKY